MKVVFLDIDGVLATPSSYEVVRRVQAAPTENNPMPEDREYFSFDPKAVENLNLVLRTTGAAIVVSSTWRLLYSLSELREILSREGVEGRVVGVTGTHPKGRGREIQEWLKREAAAVGSDKYVIIDDSVGDITEHHPENTVYVKGGWWGGAGMLREHTAQAIGILGGAA